jgi:hypothetical protein
MALGLQWICCCRRLIQFNGFISHSPFPPFWELKIGIYYNTVALLYRNQCWVQLPLSLISPWICLFCCLMADWLLSCNNRDDIFSVLCCSNYRDWNGCLWFFYTICGSSLQTWYSDRLKSRESVYILLIT